MSDEWWAGVCWAVLAGIIVGIHQPLAGVLLGTGAITLFTVADYINRPPPRP